MRSALVVESVGQVVLRYTLCARSSGPGASLSTTPPPRCPHISQRSTHDPGRIGSLYELPVGQVVALHHTRAMLQRWNQTEAPCTPPRSSSRGDSGPFVVHLAHKVDELRHRVESFGTGHLRLRRRDAGVAL